MISEFVDLLQAESIDKKNVIEHGLRFVMDYNEDRWGFMFRDVNGGTSAEDQDVLKNSEEDVNTKEINARILFQNIGILEWTNAELGV